MMEPRVCTLGGSKTLYKRLRFAMLNSFDSTADTDLRLVGKEDDTDLCCIKMSGSELVLFHLYGTT